MLSTDKFSLSLWLVFFLQISAGGVFRVGVYVPADERHRSRLQHHVRKGRFTSFASIAFENPKN